MPQGKTCTKLAMVLCRRLELLRHPFAAVLALSTTAEKLGLLLLHALQA